MSKTVVTGICGFVGSHLAVKLVGEGHEVVGLDISDKTRNTTLAKYIAEGKVKVHTGDLLAFDFSKLGSADYVYQVAGKVSAWGDISVFDRINVDGTRRVIDYAKSAGAKVIVYISSTAVYGYDGYVDLPETAPKRPMNNPYSLSKLKAETMVMDYCPKIGIPYVVIRPANLYGEYDLTSSFDIYRLLEKGKMPVIDKGRHKSCFVYAGNLADAIYKSSVTPSAYNEDYNISDGFGETLAGYLTFAAKALGVKPKFTILPHGLALFTARTVEGVWRVFKLKGAPLITLFSAKQNSVDYHFSIAKAKERFGFSPAVDLAEGTRRTAAWYKTMPVDFKVKRK